MSSVADTEGEWLIRRRAPAPTTVLAVSSFGVFMAFVDATIVNIAFPDIAESFPETDISSLSWVLNAYNIVFAAFLVAAGRVAGLLGGSPGTCGSAARRGRSARGGDRSLPRRIPGQPRELASGVPRQHPGRG